MGGIRAKALGRCDRSWNEENGNDGLVLDHYRQPLVGTDCAAVIA